MNILNSLKQAEKILIKFSDAPQLDAQRLLRHVLKIKESSWLYAHGEENLDKKTEERLKELVAERATRKPLAYILGEWEFYGRPYYVTPDVLVPRPATENLIAATLPYIGVWRDAHQGETMTIADVGTGSGIIAMTLALELSKPANTGESAGVQFIATDISEKALKIARKNARRHGVEHKIELLRGNMLEPLKNRKIDLIVSNPPYLPSSEVHRLDPRVALDGGPDGQKFVRQIQASGIPAIIETTGGQIISFPSSLLSSQVR